MYGHKVLKKPLQVGVVPWWVVCTNPIWLPPEKKEEVISHPRLPLDPCYNITRLYLGGEESISEVIFLISKSFSGSFLANKQP